MVIEINDNGGTLNIILGDEKTRFYNVLTKTHWELDPDEKIIRIRKEGYKSKSIFLNATISSINIKPLSNICDVPLENITINFKTILDETVSDTMENLLTFQYRHPFLSYIDTKKTVKLGEDIIDLVNTILTVTYTEYGEELLKTYEYLKETVEINIKLSKGVLDDVVLIEAEVSGDYTPTDSDKVEFYLDT